MSKKLTLSLDERTIEMAKKMAKRHHVSLSKLVESYFVSLIQPNPSLSKEVLDLKGAMKGTHSSRDKTILAKQLRKKFL